MSPILRYLAAALALAGLVFTSGCGDNAACVFSSAGCSPGSGTGLAADPAGAPFTGMVIDDAQPEIQSLFPNASEQAGTTPIVIVFSESMQPTSLAGAFELVSISGGVTGIGVPLGGQLVAEGRVFVAFAPMEIEIGDYQVRARGIPLDVTGQALELNIGDPDAPPGQGMGEVLSNFSIVDDFEPEPQIIAMYPPMDSINANEIGDIVVVFDRPMNVDTVDEDSFVIDNGGTSVTNPVIGPLTVGVPGAMLTEPRVIIAQMPGLDNAVTVGVTLSPPGNRIVEDGPDNAFLPTTQFFFDTGIVAVPLGGTILSDPSDAIGSSNLIEGGTNELMVQVALSGAMIGDFVDVFLFGENIDLTQRIAVRGSFEIPDMAMDPDNPILGLSAFPILIAPGEPRFADGVLDIAFRLRRGTRVSAMRVYDANPFTITVEEGVLLDTTGPEVLDLLPPGGSTALVRSDARDLVIRGEASENVRAVEVVARGMTNELMAGTPATVVGAVSGRFLSAPVPLGVVPGGSTTFTMIAYDAALNPSDPITGRFEQKGVVRTGTTGGTTFDIEVYDAETFEPLSGVTVFVHSDMGDGVNYPLFSTGSTGPDGLVTLGFNGAAADSLITADLGGYDLFTLHGMTNTGISLPLRVSGNDTSLASGTITSTDLNAAADIPDDQSVVSDTRFLFSGNRAIHTAMCVAAPALACAFGPEPIRSFSFGAQAFFAGDFTRDAADPGAIEAFLIAFDLRIPTDRVVAGSTLSSQITIEDLLAGQAPDEQAMVFPDVDFDASMTNGVDLVNLEGDPLGEDGDLMTPLPGRPRVTVEVEIPGTTGPLVVSTGAQFDLGGGMWQVRPVYPGIFERAGFLGSNDLAMDRLRVRFEVRDTSGNASGRRPLAAEFPGMFVLPDVTQLLAPGAAVSLPFNIELSNSIPDPETGLYQVVLDDGSRKWNLWRVDSAGAASVVLRVPALISAPLSLGMINVDIASFQSPGANLSSFLWSDLLNRHDRFTRTATQSITLQ